MKKLLLAGILLLPPFFAEAIDNPFAHDHRIEGVIAIGVATFVTGMYIVAKKPSKSELVNFIEGITAPACLASGVIVVLCAPDLIKKFDEMKRR